MVEYLFVRQDPIPMTIMYHGNMIYMMSTVSAYLKLDIFVLQDFDVEADRWDRLNRDLVRVIL